MKPEGRDGGKVWEAEGKERSRVGRGKRERMERKMKIGKMKELLNLDIGKMKRKERERQMDKCN